jgi:hypothetical protein
VPPLLTWNTLESNSSSRPKLLAWLQSPLEPYQEKPLTLLAGRLLCTHPEDMAMQQPRREQLNSGCLTFIKVKVLEKKTFEA